MGNPNPNPDSLAIDLHHVAKTYRGRVQALRGIEMQVRRGEIFGLLGPNGAGKSTLVKIMMTVVRPSRADGTILGHPIAHKPTLRKMGYLPEHHRFPRYLTGRQVMDFFGALHGVDRLTRRRRADELLDLVGMSPDADRHISTYSKGMMQRVGLAQALINDPELIVLDEPTDGVDPLGRRDIRNILERLRREGKTVFVNSHLLGELELIADRVAILLAGQVVKQGTIHDLAVAKQHYEVELMPQPNESSVQLRARVMAAFPGVFTPPPPQPPLPPAVQALPPLQADKGNLPSGVAIEFALETFRILATDPADIQPLLDTLRAKNFIIKRVQSVRPSLEELFMEAIGSGPTVGSTIGSTRGAG